MERPVRGSRRAERRASVRPRRTPGPRWPCRSRRPRALARRVAAPWRRFAGLSLAAGLVARAPDRPGSAPARRSRSARPRPPPLRRRAGRPRAARGARRRRAGGERRGGARERLVTARRRHQLLEQLARAARRRGPGRSRRVSYQIVRGFGSDSSRASARRPRDTRARAVGSEIASVGRHLGVRPLLDHAQLDRGRWSVGSVGERADERVRRARSGPTATRCGRSRRR